MDPEDGSPSLLHWDEESTAISLLLSLQALLSNPELDEGCIRNPVAAKLFREAPLTYKQMSLDCVTASLRVDGRHSISGITVEPPIKDPPNKGHHLF